MLEYFTGALYRWFIISLYWFSCLILAILASLFVISFESLNSSYKSSKKKRNILRKIFHFLTVIMFTPIYFVDLSFLKFSLFAAFAAFLVVEWIRFSKTLQNNIINRCRTVLTDYFTEFLHLKDRKSAQDIFITDQILLLFGVSWPIWISNSSNDIKGLSGIVTLGIGDAMASIMGNLFYHSLKVPIWMRFIIKNGKTLAGWYGNVVSMMIFYYILVRLYLFTPSWPCWMLALVSVITGSVEAMISNHNDNIVLPFVAFLSLNVMEILLK